MEEKIGWVSTWNSRCGIACDNSKGLIGNKLDQVVILAPDDEKVEFKDANNVVRCWSLYNSNYLKLIKTIQTLNLKKIVIQFNMGFFEYSGFTRMVTELVKDNRKLYVILHATREDVNPDKKVSLLKSSLNLCEKVFVHTESDIERLEKIGITTTELFPLGLYQPKEVGEKSSIMFDSESFIISSYGFFLPNKGLIELLKAAHTLLREGRDVQLALINAEYTSQQASKDLIKEAKEYIKKYHLEDRMFVKTEFLSEESALAIIRETDLVVFPYMRGDSSSGAVRMGLNSGTLTMTSSHSIFDDVRELVETIPWDGVIDIANSIADIMDNGIDSKQYEIKRMKAKEWCEERRFPMLSDRLFNIIKGKNSNE